MNEITLTEPFGGHRKGTVFKVVYPRQPVPSGHVVDSVRAESMIEKKLATPGRKKRGAPADDVLEVISDG